MKKNKAKRLLDVDEKQKALDHIRPNAYALDDRFVLRDGKTHPWALICPGGGYNVVCSYISGTPYARRLNAMGVSAFILYYRVRGKARFPHPQDDLARAIREVLSRAEEYGVDPDNYCVWGSSAGGHLAGSFGTDSMGYLHYGLPKPRAIVLCYPVISMEGELPHRQTHDNLLGKRATAAMELAASVDRQATANFPPTYLWCGDADTSVDPENTLRMARALEAAGVPCRCEVFPNVIHGVGPGTGTTAEGWIEKAVAFWREQE